MFSAFIVLYFTVTLSVESKLYARDSCVIASTVSACSIYLSHSHTRNKESNFLAARRITPSTWPTVSFSS